MSSDLIEKIQQLIDSGTGDVGRLQYILEKLQNGRKLYNSDQSYLDNLLNNHEGHAAIQPEEDKSPVRSNEDSADYIPPKQSKPKKLGTRYGISYHPHTRDIVRIHHGSCRHVRLASQNGQTRWNFVHGYQEARSEAESIANNQGIRCKNAKCCLNGIIGRTTSSAIFPALFPFLGILGGLIVREYHPTFGKGLMYFGLIYGIFAVVLYLASQVAR
jgi:hypothetical protein